MFKLKRNWTAGGGIGEWLTLDEAESCALAGIKIDVVCTPETARSLFALIPTTCKAVLCDGQTYCIGNGDGSFPELQPEARPAGSAAAGHEWNYFGIMLPVATIHGRQTGSRNEAGEKRVRRAFASLRAAQNV